MAYELLSERDLNEGFHQIFIYVNDITGGLFMNGIITAIFLIIMFGVYFGNKKTIGEGDFPVAFAVAGFVTSIIAILFRLIPGLLSGETLTVVIIVAFIGLLWLLFTDRN